MINRLFFRSSFKCALMFDNLTISGVSFFTANMPDPDFIVAIPDLLDQECNSTLTLDFSTLAN